MRLSTVPLTGLGGSSILRKLLHQASLRGKAIQDAWKYGWKFEEQGSAGCRKRCLCRTSRISVNEKEQSSVGYVYTVGACDYSNVPMVLFTPMEYATCGLSEENAILKFEEDNVEVYHRYYWPLEWTVPRRDKNSCYAKVICHIPDQVLTNLTVTQRATEAMMVRGNC
ncbi:hypothetical protein J4Q44_G00143680 [Coregonus suidteri]|uniref:Thioredoxin reductase 1, cytoplasmic n=1 Tax=Coregonus suidteri TaxID=861788 RepID=A0AAN8QSG8_9TELE